MKAQVVSFHCILKNQLGRLISSTFNHDVLTSPGADTALLRGLADGMQDLKKGEKRRICLSAEKAYGLYDPTKVIEFDRDEVDRPLKHGQEVIVRDQAGEEKSLRVVKISADTVTLDGNHPLAGQDLVFEIEATQARDATAEELNDLNENDTSLH